MDKYDDCQWDHCSDIARCPCCRKDNLIAELEAKIEIDKITMDNFLKRITKMEIAKDQSDRLTHKIAELEAVIKLQKGAIAAKDKSSRQQIKKHTALEDGLNLLTAQVQEIADAAWPNDAPINSGWLLDELALLGKENEDG